MNKQTSLYLDLMRALSSLVVVFFHYSGQIHPYEPHQRVFPDIGMEAVMVFFVMSGFIIAWVAETKESSPVLFFTKRLSRFWSVMIPALIVATVAIRIVSTRHPEFYEIGGVTFHMNHPWLRYVMTMSFMNYNSVAWHRIVPFTEPYWSLTFEWWYYVIFALWFFSNRKWFPIVATVFLGLFLPREFLLLPVWLMGVVSYRVSRTIRWNRGWSALLFVGSVIAIWGLWASGLRDRLSTEALFGLDLEQPSFFIYFWMLGALMSLNLLAFISLTRDRVFSLPGWITRSIRHGANVSFSLYLIHIPIMFSLKALLGRDPYPFLIPICAITLIYLVGKPVEDSRIYYQRLFRYLAERTGFNRIAAWIGASGWI